MKSMIQIGGMTCKHCVAHVSALVAEFLPENKFKVNLESKNIEIEEEGNNMVEKIKLKINEDGRYKAL